MAFPYIESICLRLSARHQSEFLIIMEIVLTESNQCEEDVIVSENSIYFKEDQILINNFGIFFK